jgi:hypothetical protein
MPHDLEQVYKRLYSYCQSEGFAGHDPFDGLSSGLFRVTPLKHVSLARLLWLQFVKRSPMDLRSVLRVPKDVNPKGLALFAMAEMALYRSSHNMVHREHAEAHLVQLRNRAIVSKTHSGQRTTAFGYNFDWQSRSFFAPRGTPAIVPTAFAQQAFLEAYASFGEARFLETAVEICGFITANLNRPM